MLSQVSQYLGPKNAIETAELLRLLASNCILDDKIALL